MVHKKKTGINLHKTSDIFSKKDKDILKKVFIRLSWQVIKKKMLFGLVDRMISVDLDLGLTAFDKKNKSVYSVYYRNLESPDSAIKHDGDDRTGDVDEEAKDDSYNEIVSIDLLKVKEEVEQIVIYLNSYKGQDFSNIPNAKIDIYYTTSGQYPKILATFNLSADVFLAGNVSMIIGKLVRSSESWEYTSIGEPIKAFRINETIEVIKDSYLS